MANIDFPSETIELPSRGWFYPEGHPLASGRLDVYYMTAKHEDILTSRNLIQKGVVIQKLLDALIATPNVKYGDLLIGDKNALMIAARVLGYGKDYEVDISCPSCNTKQQDAIDLTKLEERPITFEESKKGFNEFTYTLPIMKKVITFKLMTERDEELVSTQIEALRRNAGKLEPSQEMTTRMWSSILSVDGDTDRINIRSTVNKMPARDAHSFREYAKSVTPDVDFTYNFSCAQCGHEERMEVPFSVGFFWPQS
jgi:hypothetical protein